MFVDVHAPEKPLSQKATDQTDNGYTARWQANIISVI